MATKLGFSMLDHDIFPVFNGEGSLADRWIDRWELGMIWHYDIKWVHE